MLRRTLRHMRGNVVAYLALFIAVPSGSYAASAKLLPRNSVGTNQVVNYSLLKKDFKRGQLPRGPQGPQGEPGEEGPRGPSNAFAGDLPVIVGEVPDTPGNIGHVTLPAGDFVVFAKAAFVNPGAETLVECSLAPTGQPNNPFDRGNLKLLETTPGDFYDAGVVSLVASTFGTSVNGFDFRCEDNNGTVQFFDQKTRAIQVESVRHLP